jgi:hypothetical protein
VDRSDLVEAVVYHLGAQGWTAGRCDTCNREFLAPVHRTTCAADACGTPDESLRSRRPVFWDDIWPTVRTTFEQSGFSTTRRTDLINHVGRTRFVGAGLQIFEFAIYRGADVPHGRLFVPQPAIRLNYLDCAGCDGFSTSFINVCSEQAKAGVSDFLSNVDYWIGCLIALRFPFQTLTLVVPSGEWRGGPFRGHAFVLRVSGIVVGDLVLIDDGAPEVQRLLPIVDTSFGLERLVSAANPGLRYSTLIGPLPFSAEPALTAPLDHIRTATLMLMTGLSPSGRGRGRILRSLSTTDIPSGRSLDVDAVVTHAYTYWSHFQPPQRELGECQSIIRAERDRRLQRRTSAGPRPAERAAWHQEVRH